MVEDKWIVSSEHKIDPNIVENKIESLIEEASSKQISGPKKKKEVLRKLARWLDEHIKSPGLLELVDGSIIYLSLVILDTWVEAVFRRWKIKLNPLFKQVLETLGAPEFASVVDLVTKLHIERDAALGKLALLEQQK